ncbi:MAG: hypothetical protein P8P83_00765 [Rickettsiaceae bacterium]|nr:hypothetical protein [Rickettsiaceae bacterium]
MNNKKTSFFKALACFSALSLSFGVSSKAFAVENTEDFTNVVTFGDSFVKGAGSYAQTFLIYLRFMQQLKQTLRLLRKELWIMVQIIS